MGQDGRGTRQQPHKLSLKVHSVRLTACYLKQTVQKMRCPTPEVTSMDRAIGPFSGAHKT